MEFPFLSGIYVFRKVYKTFFLISFMKKGCKRVVISTIYNGEAVRHAILKFAPDKLILLVDEPDNKKKKEKISQVIKTIKDFFKDSLIVEQIKISTYNLPEIMDKAIKIIDEEYEKENEIITHITEGRKIASLALLFATYARKEKIKDAYYITEEEKILIKLPLLNFEINKTKKSFLKEIAKGNGELKELQKKIDLGPSATYQNIDELKKEGYLEKNKELELTELGRIMIL